MESPATEGGGGLTGKRQRGQVGRETQEAASPVQCVLGEVRVGKGIVKGQVVIRLAEVVACRRRKQAKRVSEERRVVMSDGAQLVTTLRVITGDRQSNDDRSDTDRGTYGRCCGARSLAPARRRTRHDVLQIIMAFFTAASSAWPALDDLGRAASRHRSASSARNGSAGICRPR